MNAGGFAKTTEKSKKFSMLKHKRVENMDDHGCHKFQELVDPIVDDQLWNWSRHPIRHKTTLHCADRKSKKNVSRTKKQNVTFDLWKAMSVHN